MEMEKRAKKGEPIYNNPEKHLYYKGAYIMEAPDYTWWEAENDELRKLVPVRMVQTHLKELKKQNLRTAIGVYIHNRTLAMDTKFVNFEDDYGPEAAGTIEHWRTRSSYRTFVTEMKRIIKEEDADAKFYIASDIYEIISIMKKKFPGRILSTRRKCNNRSSDCVKYAVIDMYALSRTRQLLDSNWSSYTEMVERLGGLKARLAGRDFGDKSSTIVEAGSPEEDVQKPEEKGKTEDGERHPDSKHE